MLFINVGNNIGVLIRSILAPVMGVLVLLILLLLVVIILLFVIKHLRMRYCITRSIGEVINYLIYIYVGNTVTTGYGMATKIW